jgi:uncharacterized protein YggE
MRPLLPPLVVALAMLSPSAFAATSDQIPSISIEGKGEAVAAPDTAAVTAGVTTEGATAREALAANSKAMAQLISTLKAAKIDAKDIQTSGFSVNPQYVYPDKDASGAPPRITGYEVQNGVSVKVRQLDDLGPILDSVVSAGGNTINGVQFSIEDPTKLLEEARKAAFADAEAKAKTYADAAGIGLGSILSISEGPSETPPRPVMFKAAAPMARSAVPVEAGQLTYDVDVSVVWALKTAAD